MTKLISQVASESRHGARAIKVLSAAVGVARASFYRHRRYVVPTADSNLAETELRRTIEGIALEMPNWLKSSVARKPNWQACVSRVMTASESSIARL